MKPENIDHDITDGKTFSHENGERVYPLIVALSRLVRRSLREDPVNQPASSSQSD